jgi:hypothetical protein
MRFKSLPLSFARCLLRLQNGEKLKAGEITSKSLLKRFYSDGAIQSLPVGNRRVEYICRNHVALQNYLQTQHDILSLEEYIRQFEADSSDGESSLKATKLTKAFRDRSLRGFFIKAYNTEIKISGISASLPPDGIELFVYQPENLQISDSAIIVGVENPECFTKFQQLCHLFPKSELIVVMRYMTISPNNWLQTVSNQYMHFGDFDPAGISIYIHEFRNKLTPQRCSFFIPDNIEQLIIRYGTTTLYDQQIHLLKNIDIQQYPEAEYLFRILHKYGKGLEQERLLSI